MLTECYPEIKILREKYANVLKKTIELIFNKFSEEKKEINLDGVLEIPSKGDYMFCEVKRTLYGSLVGYKFDDGFLRMNFGNKLNIIHIFLVKFAYIYFILEKSSNKKFDGLYLTYDEDPIVLFNNDNSIETKNFIQFDLINLDGILNDLGSLNSYKNFLIAEHESIIEVEETKKLNIGTCIVAGVIIYGVFRFIGREK